MSRIASLKFIVIAISMIANTASAQLVVLEPGFQVVTLPTGVGAKGIECSPGGIWGDFVYVADSSAGMIERIDFSDNVTTFATGLGFPVGMDFGPGPAANFGNFLYVANNLGDISRVDTSGAVTSFTPFSNIGDVKFDPSGVYGNDLFATTAFSGPTNSVDNLGVVSFFSSTASTYLRFGPGGAWGTGLYATDDVVSPGIVTIDAAGIPTAFSVGFTTAEGFDWASGTLFAGDMFATDLSTGEIWRVQSTGARSLFATLPQASDVSFCNGDLYVVSFAGECYRVSDQQVAGVPGLSGSSWATLVLVGAICLGGISVVRRRAGISI